MICRSEQIMPEPSPLTADEMIWEMQAGGALVTELPYRSGVSMSVRYRDGAVHHVSSWREVAVASCWRWFRCESGRMCYAA